MSVDISKLRDLLAAATPGPWKPDYGTVTSAVGDIIGADISYGTPMLELDPANAALICAAVNALPELLAIAEAAGDYVDAERTKNRYSAAQYHALLAAFDAARKETP